MNDQPILSVFLPHHIINKISRICYVFGYKEESLGNVLVNCLIFVESNSKHSDGKFLQFLHDFPSTSEKQKIGLLGLIYCTKEGKKIKEIIENNNSILFILKFNKVSGAFNFDKCYTKVSSVCCGRVIIYDTSSIMKSHLLPTTKNISCSDAVNFVSFLVQTCNSFHTDSLNVIEKEITNNLQVRCLKYTNEDIFPKILSNITNLIILLLFRFYNVLMFVITSHSSFLNIFLMTTIGQQFHQRFLHCTCIVNESKKEISLKCKNLICAITIDIIVGILLSSVLLQSEIPDLMLDTAILKTNEIVSELQNLISWLMGVPAGLKLNIPLNSALGKFFLYHIYLWESYMMVVQPLFAFILRISTVVGVFGLTFFISALNDLISLATIHIYCFYGYATRLYGYQVTSLSALWRLFRGKKWNPLRQRIDSYTYDVYQLYLGTLLFTVLLFLLPTVMVYYVVFACLRVLVLFIQGIMSRVINFLSILPVYSVIMRLMNSNETTGDVYFTVLNAEEDLVLSMQASQLPLKSVINMTLPDLNKYHEILTWKEFMSSIIWGKIVYPL